MRFVTTLIFLLTTLTPASGQVVIASDPATACTDCLELTRVMSLGEEDGPGYLEVTKHLAVDGRGRYWVGLAEEIKVFGPDGSFLRTVGRQGQGPGEFRNLTALVRDMDGLIVAFDSHNQRATVFSLEGEPVLTSPTRGAIRSAVFFEDGGLLGNLISNESDIIGLPLHFIDLETGEITRSFGAREEEHFNLRARWPGWRNLAPGPNGRLWVSSRTEYKLTEWNVRTGQFLRDVDRRIGSFPANPAETRGPGDQSPPSTLESIRLDDQGRLWALVVVAAPDWREHMVPVTLRTGQVVDQPDKLENLYETIIEIIDPNSGELQLSQRFPQMIWGFLDGNRVYGVREDQNGVVRIEIWELVERGSDSPMKREVER